MTALFASTCALVPVVSRRDSWTTASAGQGTDLIPEVGVLAAVDRCVGVEVDVRRWS